MGVHRAPDPGGGLCSAGAYASGPTASTWSAGGIESLLNNFGSSMLPSGRPSVPARAPAAFTPRLFNLCCTSTESATPSAIQPRESATT